MKFLESDKNWRSPPLSFPHEMAGLEIALTDRRYTIFGQLQQEVTKS